MDLPLAGVAAERSDAARNRQALLEAARSLMSACSVDSLTMDAVAAAAGVGKGTVFRRFGSREGLMTALLSDQEASWQSRVLSGPPPLGPGAPPRDRLAAFAASRLDVNCGHAALLKASGSNGRRSSQAWGFVLMHIEMLLRAAGATGDLHALARFVAAPLSIDEFEQASAAGLSRERQLAAWVELVDRLIA